jgi:hypothetical protein
LSAPARVRQFGRSERIEKQKASVRSEGKLPCRPDCGMGVSSYPQTSAFVRTFSCFAKLENNLEGTKPGEK